MYCSFCQRDVDINSVSQTNITGGSVKGYSYDSPYSDISPSANSISLTSESRLINVCKSCGKTEYLFTNRVIYERQRIREEREREDIRRRRKMEAEIEARTPVPKLVFLMSIGRGVLCLLLTGVCLWAMLNLFTEEDTWGKFVMILGIVFFGVAALYWFFMDLPSIIALNNKKKQKLRAFQNKVSQISKSHQVTAQLNVHSNHHEITQEIQDDQKKFSPDQPEYYMPQGGSDEPKTYTPDQPEYYMPQGDSENEK